MDSLPLDIIKYQIYPLLSIKDLLAMEQTCKNFLLDENDWKYLCERDFQRGYTKEGYQYAHHIHKISDWYVNPTDVQKDFLKNMGYVVNGDHYELKNMNTEPLMTRARLYVFYSTSTDEIEYSIDTMHTNIPRLFCIKNCSFYILTKYVRDVYDFYHGDGEWTREIRNKSNNFPGIILQKLIDFF